MPVDRVGKRLRHQEVEEEERRAAAPILIRVRTSILLHDRAPKGSSVRCPCCQSKEARLVETKRDLDVVIDTTDGARWFRHLNPTSEWERLADPLPLIEIPLRCTSHTEPVLYSDAEVIYLSGGVRSAKTHTLSGRAVRRWLLRGGAHREFLITAPELEQCHIIKDKLVTGGGADAPLFPPDLVVSYPDTIRSPDQFIRLLDGSAFRLRHAKSGGGNIKGKGYFDIFGTEITEISHHQVLSNLIGRTASTGGTVALDGQPVDGHWVEELILDTSREEDERERQGEDFLRSSKVFYLASKQNVWVNEDDVARRRAIVAKKDPEQARRDFDGEWSTGSLIFPQPEVWDGSRLAFDLEGVDIDQAGLKDITKRVSRRFFKGDGVAIVGSCDVNRNPHTILVAKCFGDPRDEETWGVFIIDEIVIWDKYSYEAARELRSWDRGAYRNMGLAMDAESAEQSHRAHVGSNRASTPRKDFRREGFNCRPVNRTDTGAPKNPSIRDSLAVVRRLMRDDRLLINATRCGALIRAIEKCKRARDTGKPAGKENKWTDAHVIAKIDCLRYLVWPLFSRQVLRERKVRFSNVGT